MEAAGCTREDRGGRPTDGPASVGPSRAAQQCHLVGWK